MIMACNSCKPQIQCQRIWILWKVVKIVSVWFSRLHNHGKECWLNSCAEEIDTPDKPWEDCQAKAIQNDMGASQGVEWGRSQCIKSHHTDISRICATTTVAFLVSSHSSTRDNVRSVSTWLKDLVFRSLVCRSFHFPAGLGICPHYQKYQYLV